MRTSRAALKGDGDSIHQSAEHVDEGRNEGAQFEASAVESFEAFPQTAGTGAQTIVLLFAAELSPTPECL